MDASKFLARAEAYHPLDSALERLIRKALVELAEPVDINMMIAIIFDRIIDAVDDDAGLGDDDFIDDDFPITRRRLNELFTKALNELDCVRLESMVNTRDAVAFVARRLGPLIDDCVANGIPRPRRQPPRPRSGGNRKRRRVSSAQRAA